MSHHPKPETHNSKPLILALDAGTTSVRACLYDAAGTRLASAQEALTQHFPQPGWVEHDAQEIAALARRVLRAAVAGVEITRIAALGITNQRETVVLWDRATGTPLHRALVWQDRRTADACQALRAAGAEAEISARTGLLLDPYFSATKLAWLLDQVPGTRARAQRGELAAGTIDSWLVWSLTGGRVHATDPTNASRTLLYDLAAGAWDAALCQRFTVPRDLLPEIRDSDGEFGVLASEVLGQALPIRALIGDQQAAAVGQAVLVAGTVKATYGTGCFVLLHTGTAAPRSKSRLLTTVALCAGGTTTYALEGSIFNAGTVIQWLRDQVGLIASAGESATLAASVPDSGGVVVVPAFTGLGAPWWDPEARGLICGLSRDSGRAQIVRAALESVAYQTEDLLTAMRADGGHIARLRVDGGMVANDWLCQFLADQLALPVERPADVETTVRGAAALAAQACGLISDPATWWRSERTFTPRDDGQRAVRRARWHDAVRRTTLRS